MRPLSRRAFLATAAGAAVAARAPSAAAPRQPAAAPLLLDDASRLNAVPIARHAIVRSSDDALIAELRALLKAADEEGRCVAAGGARHSMGGQSLPRQGVAASLDSTLCAVDRAARVYRVGAGMRWRDVIAKLDPLGFSVAVMQSNHDFSVGGTLSANAHGWPVPFGPFGTTVRALRVMLADGSVVTCSRRDDPQLFALVIGGYGLFGIVLDVELDMVENTLLEPSYEVLPAESFAGRFTAAVKQPLVQMGYGRLSVARDGFLRDAVLVTNRRAGAQPQALPPPTGSGSFSMLSRAVFRAQTGSDSAKKRRWYIETVLAPKVVRQPVTRNTLINQPVAALAGGDRRRTDILHEYFIPPARFGDFLAACRATIPRSEQDLLNVTLRYVAADTVSALPFAPDERIAAVMLFSQVMTRAADEDMRRMTERLIDQALELGGSFYLPYRLHARPDQLRAAYPRLDEVIARKRHYDPHLRLRNLMWDKYFA